MLGCEIDYKIGPLLVVVLLDIGLCLHTTFVRILFLYGNLRHFYFLIKTSPDSANATMTQQQKIIQLLNFYALLVTLRVSPEYAYRCEYTCEYVKKMSIFSLLLNIIIVFWIRIVN